MHFQYTEMGPEMTQAICQAIVQQRHEEHQAALADWRKNLRITPFKMRLDAEAARTA
jgi:hypothetical protein